MTYNTNSESVLLISCDLAGLLPKFAATAREAMGKATGPTSRNVIIACTHTHSGPSLLPTNYLKDLDREYMEQLQGWLVELAREAVGAARPARVGSGVGRAQIGYNRRCCWADGTHMMHGDTKRRSPTRHTAICSIADGYGGYCPTMSGVLGGGYSGEPIWWARLSPESGYQIVDSAAKLMNQVMRQGESK